MLALVIRWDVDLNQVKDGVNLSAGQEISQSTEIRNDLVEVKTRDNCEKLGTAYKDPVPASYLSFRMNKIVVSA